MVHLDQRDGLSWVGLSMMAMTDAITWSTVMSRMHRHPW